MKLKERIHHFLYDQKLKHKLYVIIFESDTPAGKLFDVILICFILLSVLLVIIESLKGLPTYLATPFVIMEYIFTAFFLNGACQFCKSFRLVHRVSATECYICKVVGKYFFQYFVC